MVERPLTAKIAWPCRRQSWWGQRYALMLSGLRCLDSNRPRIRATELTDRVGRKGLDKAERSEPKLAAKLRALLSIVQTAASGEASGGPDSFDEEMDGEMERTAAVALHSALLELLSASQPDEELASIWAESTAATVNARFQGLSGQLTIKPPADDARDLQKWLARET